MTKPIYIHAGAQRSGSSSFQLCLAHNRALLTQAGFDLAYPGRDGAPKGQLKLRFPGRKEDEGKVAVMAKRAARNIAIATSDPARDLILSEENIPGRIYPIFKGRLFPDASKRAGIMRMALGGGLTIFLSFCGLVQICSYRLTGRGRKTTRCDLVQRLCRTC